MGELSEMLEPFELEFFYHKKVTAQKTDILLENMLDYVSLEMYEYAVIIRDEINSRK
jgi:protein-arginine kinase activator protein McsA